VLTAEPLETEVRGDKARVVIPIAEASEGQRRAETVWDADVRRQLHRIVESEVFRRSAQMERFLTLAVERALEGRPEELKEYALGRDVFNRGEDYDPRTDSIVRVEAQRLRRKLREYYESHGGSDPVVITLPPGSYVPAFEYRHMATGRARFQAF
jgi:hypothetical protein